MWDEENEQDHAYVKSNTNAEVKENLLDKPTPCKVTKAGKISLLIITLLVFVSGPINMYFCDYYDKKNKDIVAMIFLGLIAISIPFCIALPVITAGAWGYFK